MQVWAETIILSQPQTSVFYGGFMTLQYNVVQDYEVEEEM